MSIDRRSIIKCQNREDLNKTSTYIYTKGCSLNNCYDNRNDVVNQYYNSSDDTFKLNGTNWHRQSLHMYTRNDGGSLLDLFPDSDLKRFLKLALNSDDKSQICIYDAHTHSKYIADTADIAKMLYPDTEITKARNSTNKFLAKMAGLNLIKKVKGYDAKTGKSKHIYLINTTYALHVSGTNGKLNPAAYTAFNMMDDAAGGLNNATCQMVNTRIFYDKHPDAYADCHRYDDDIMDQGLYFEGCTVKTVEEKAVPMPETDKMAIFRDNILKQPHYYNASFAEISSPEAADNTNVFYLSQISDNKGRKQDNITAYHLLPLDFDFGYSDNPDYKYADLATVAARKASFRQIMLPLLPTPTAIVDTRNGYHILYSLTITEDKNQWLSLCQTVKSIITTADPTITGDAARLLRLPGCRYHKTDKQGHSYDYDVTIYAASNNIYGIKSLTDKFNASKIQLAEADKKIINLYPGLKPIKVVHIGNIINKRTDIATDRLNDIANLTTDSFADASSILRVMTKAETINYLTHDIDMANYLWLPHTTFRCIVHDDHNPSAYIIKCSDGVYRYFCGSANCPLSQKDHAGQSLIDMVTILSGCTYTQAINYLAKTQNIQITAANAA
jgi:hypothetical protein